MPYIEKAGRPEFDSAIEKLNPVTEGDLNYIFARLAQRYLVAHGLRYQHVNAVVGALECAKLEAYRRIAAPYEDIKISENGDVLESELARRLGAE